MKKHRNNSKDLLLISGQGRLSQALSICRSLNGIDMTDTTCDLRIEFGVEQQGIKATPRIGWRFALLTGTESGNLTNKFAS